MKTGVIVALAAISLLLAEGCVFIADNTIEPDNFHNARHAGGGLEISYIAPEDGVLKLIDERTDRNLMSKSVTKGELYEFSAKALDPAEEKQWGVDIKKANFVLFFYPNPKAPVPQPMPPVPPVPPAPPAPQP
ncbi:MAG: hypothetical protein LLF76_02180 [Planctomycetaceae bacterium]|nr:hypothetical protein [Planctomycetaceae bacterium]